MTVDEHLAAVLQDLFGIPPDDLHPAADLEADLSLDSLAIVELQVALEDRLGVRIDPEDPASISSLGDLSSVVARAVDRGQPALPRLQLSEDP